MSFLYFLFLKFLFQTNNNNKQQQTTTLLKHPFRYFRQTKTNDIIF